MFKENLNIGQKTIIDEIAKSLELNVKDMNNAIDRGLYDQEIHKASQTAKNYNVTSVPTFIVDEERNVTDLKEYKYFKADLLG